MTGRTVLWCIGLVLLVAVTNRRTDPVADRALIEDAAGDSYSYLAIAEAAPEFPRDSITFHHAQRLALPWMIGVVRRAVPVSPHTLFWISVLALECAILLVVASTLDTLAIRGRSAEFVLAMLAFNPWVFRQYVTFPEMANDLAFVLGLAMMVRGLVRASIGGVAGGQIVASLGRQTGVLLIPAVMFWMWYDRDRWSGYSTGARTLVVAATAGIAVSIYVLTARIGAQFALPSENAEHLTGIFAWALRDFDVAVLGAFLILLGAVIAIPVVAAGVALRMPHVRARDSAARVPLVVAFLCAAIQPVLAGPVITGGNGERLVGLGLVALVVAVAIQLRDAGLIGFGDVRMSRFIAAIMLLGAGSLHHLYVRPELAIVTGRAVFGGLYAAVCVAMGLLMWSGGLHSRSMHRSVQPGRRAPTTPDA